MLVGVLIFHVSFNLYLKVSELFLQAANLRSQFLQTMQVTTLSSSSPLSLMAKDKDRLRLKQPDRSERISVPQAAQNPDHSPPNFRLRGMKNGFSTEDCEKDERASFASRLYQLSRSKWSELRQMPRHGQGFETIPRNAINDGIPSEITDDITILAFRFHGKAPMVGYRSRDGVFDIVWLDRSFTLYDHG